MRYNSCMHRTIISCTVVVLALPFLVSASTVADLQAQLKALQAQLTSLQQANAQSTASTPTISRTLSKGMSGKDVTTLQNFLVAQGFLAVGNATGFFGSLMCWPPWTLTNRENTSNVCIGSFLLARFLKRPSSSGYSCH